MGGGEIKVGGTGGGGGGRLGGRGLRLGARVDERLADGVGGGEAERNEGRGDWGLRWGETSGIMKVGGGWKNRKRKRK